MDYIEITKRDIEIERTILKNYKKEYRGMPKGNLLRSRKESGDYYYHIIDNKRKYIKKEEKTLVSQLKRKRYLQESIERLENNIEAQNKMLKKYRLYEFGTVENNLPKTYQTGKEIKLFKSQPLHQTSCGLKVRSKSEVLIVEALIARNIEFEYEKRLELTVDGRTITIFPDFAFKTRYGTWIYWEHFGMLGLESYREKTMLKIETYIENGIFPSQNLLVTCESFDGALDMVSIMNTIDLLEKLL